MIGCPITVWPNATHAYPHQCSKPLAESSRFCPHHTAECTRLGGTP